MAWHRPTKMDIHCLKMWKISHEIINFIEKTMQTWRLELTAGWRSFAETKIQRGIFQWYALLPLLFIIAMMLLNHILRKCADRYKLSGLQEEINHLMYMDDIKLYAKNEKELETLIHAVRIYSQDIGMEFGIEKMYLENREDGDLPASKTALMHRDNIEKHERRLITAIRNNTDNTIDDRMTTIRKQTWEEKQPYGRFKSLINNISHQKIWTWLRKGNFNRETESFLIAAQDNAIITNHIKARIDKTQQNCICRLCSDRDETINHWVGTVIHWEMCKKFKFDHTNKWYMHNPAPLPEK